MSDNIFWMFISALLTFILELFFFKKEFKNIVNNKYLTKIVFLINFITNLLFNTLRSILIPDTEIGYILLFVIPEIIVIVVEYFMYKYAFKNLIEEEKINKKELFKVTLLANVFSAVIGTLLLWLIYKLVINYL